MISMTSLMTFCEVEPWCIESILYPKKSHRDILGKKDKHGNADLLLNAAHANGADLLMKEKNQTS